MCDHKDGNLGTAAARYYSNRLTREREQINITEVLCLLLCDVLCLKVEDF